MFQACLFSSFLYFFVLLVASEECQNLTKVFIPPSRDKVWEVFDQCARNRNCSISYNELSGNQLQFERINTGWDVDPECQKVLEEFHTECTQAHGQMFGGNDNSSFVWIFDIFEKVPDSGFAVQGPHPLCFPKVCLNATQQDIFHVVKLWIQPLFLLSLSDMALEMHSRDGRETLTYERQSILPEEEEEPVPEERNQTTTETPDPSSYSSLKTILAITVPLGFVLAIAVFLILKKRRRTSLALDEPMLDYVDELSPRDRPKVHFQGSITDTGSRSGTGHSQGGSFAANAMLQPEQITIVDMLGKGTFGAVYKGDYLGKTVAIKVLFAQEDFDEFDNEVQLLSNLHHPNIVQFIGTSSIEGYGACVVTEFMENGDLRTVLQQCLTKQVTVPWFQSSFSKLNIALDVISGLLYLHSLPTPIIHRDLKSRNILISRHYVAKIADFGVSRQLSHTSTMTAVGSNLWLSPEVLRGDRYDEKADIYAFGVVLTELDTEQLPFYDAYAEGVDHEGKKLKLNALALTYRVSNRNLRPSLTATCDPSIEDLAVKCMHADAEQRPNAWEVLAALKSIQATNQ